MIVLAHEREHQRHDIALERKPRNDAFVERLIRGQQDVDSDLEPRSLRPLARMIKTRQLSRLKLAFDSRVGYVRHQPDAFEAARVFSRQTVKRLFDLLYRAFWQFPVVLVLNSYRHNYRFLQL